MDRCGACGATLGAGLGWCGQCFAPTTAAATPAPAARSVFAPAPPRVGRPAPAAPPVAQFRTTRWAKTTTTFGPGGRLLATFALLVPLAPMVVGGLADPFVWVGILIWGGVVMPWALRDIWKVGKVPLG